MLAFATSSVNTALLQCEVHLQRHAGKKWEKPTYSCEMHEATSCGNMGSVLHRNYNTAFKNAHLHLTYIMEATKKM